MDEEVARRQGESDGETREDPPGQEEVVRGRELEAGEAEGDAVAGEEEAPAAPGVGGQEAAEEGADHDEDGEEAHWKENREICQQIRQLANIDVVCIDEAQIKETEYENQHRIHNHIQGLTRRKPQANVT